MRAWPVVLLLVSSVAAADDEVPPTPPDVPPAPVEAPPPVAPTPAADLYAPPPPAPEPKPDKRDKKDDAPPTSKKLKIGSEGTFQPGSLMQGWFLADSAGGNTQLSTIRLRRAEISAKGEIVPHRVSYQLMADFAKLREFQNKTLTDSNGDTVVVSQPVSAVSALQDFYITYLTPYADISIGQFKIPVSWEGYNPSAKLLFPERAPVAKQFGDIRDGGIRITKTFDKLMYSAGVFDGTTLNNFDNNNQKDAALRLEAYPVDGLVLAAVAYGSIGYRGRPGTHDRYEGDLRYEHGPLLFQSEYIEARDVDGKGKTIPARGFYAAVAYKLDKLQPVARLGYLDPNADLDLDPKTANGLDEFWHWDLGLNYYVKGQEMKYQLAYERQAFQNKVSNNEIIFAAQVWY